MPVYLFDCDRCGPQELRLAADAARPAACECGGRLRRCWSGRVLTTTMAGSHNHEYVALRTEKARRDGGL